jgi:ParB-like chromosome segregation protein Spo0J
VDKNKANPADDIEQWSIDKLVPYARNSRTHSDEQIAQLAASIKEFGFTTAVLVDEQGGILAGHCRVIAARKLGLKSLPVMVAEGWSETKRLMSLLIINWR